MESHSEQTLSALDKQRTQTQVGRLPDVQATVSVWLLQGSRVLEATGH